MDYAAGGRYKTDGRTKRNTAAGGANTLGSKNKFVHLGFSSYICKVDFVGVRMINI